MKHAKETRKLSQENINISFKLLQVCNQNILYLEICGSSR
jgi:hypothetical protein